MKLKELYDLIILKGREADLRCMEGTQVVLNRNKQAFDRMLAEEYNLVEELILTNSGIPLQYAEKVAAPHYASDSLGLTLLFDEVLKKR